MTDEDFMRRAIALARRGEGRTNPNPLVGAVIVRGGAIIGEGFHHAYGDLHAERDALKNCYQNGGDPVGATIYVTLEPCCHFGKQPPCTHALVEAGIVRVVVGSRDPNPLVHGKGNAYLREHSIVVAEDFLRGECDSLNPIFFHYITTGLPFVALKYAMTADGKIATRTGESKWISNEQSREFVHVLRNRYAGIMAGIGTVLSDDPMLDCRLVDEAGRRAGRNPVRIVCDSGLRISLESRLVRTAREIPTIVACAVAGAAKPSLVAEKKSALESAGVEVIEVPCASVEESTGENPKPQVNLRELMSILGGRKIDSVLVEGGSSLNFSALRSGIVSKIYAFVAPKVFGGAAKSPVGGAGVAKVSKAFAFGLENVTRFGDDVLLEYASTATKSV